MVSCMVRSGQSNGSAAAARCAVPLHLRVPRYKFEEDALGCVIRHVVAAAQPFVRNHLHAQKGARRQRERSVNGRPAGTSRCGEPSTGDSVQRALPCVELLLKLPWAAGQQGGPPATGRQATLPHLQLIAHHIVQFLQDAGHRQWRHLDAQRLGTRLPANQTRELQRDWRASRCPINYFRVLARSRNS